RGHAELASGSYEAGASTLRQALGLWRAATVTDAPGESGRMAAARLEEARLSAVEARMEADLACGWHDRLVGELDVLCATYPYREALWSARIRALYRSGRQADALRSYQELRSTLIADL